MDGEYTTPETGYTAEGAHYNQLRERVRAHRIANGLPMDTFDEDFEDGLCTQLGIECSHCGQPEPISKKRMANANDVLRFLDVVKSAWTNKEFELVDQGEADRRAAICAGCEHNAQVVCPGCKNFVRWVFGDEMKGKGTPHDGKLKSCMVCGCQNAVKVWIPPEYGSGIPTDIPYPEHCWVANGT